MKNRALKKVTDLIRKMNEDVMASSLPTNNIGSQLNKNNPVTIAGLPPEQPPAFKRRKKDATKGSDGKIYLGDGSRKRWMKYNNK
jgi:hypothetical protein